jgi:hypothetical protein
MLPSTHCSVAISFAFIGIASAGAAVSGGRSVETACVTQIGRTPVADLVVLDAGLEAGLRQGMICIVTRGGEKIGELQLVDLRPQASNAVILDIKAGQSLLKGDQVAVKTVSSRK